LIGVELQRSQPASVELLLLLLLLLGSTYNFYLLQNKDGYGYVDSCYWWWWWWWWWHSMS
jgi:hypothetical protein